MEKEYRIIGMNLGKSYMGIEIYLQECEDDNNCYIFNPIRYNNELDIVTKITKEKLSQIKCEYIHIDYIGGEYPTIMIDEDVLKNKMVDVDNELFTIEWDREARYPECKVNLALFTDEICTLSPEHKQERNINMSISEFFDEKYKNRDDKDNIFGVGMTDSEFRYFIIQYLLPDDWYVTDPLGKDQINEIAIYDILKEYSKKFKKELKKIKKNKNK